MNKKPSAGNAHSAKALDSAPVGIMASQEVIFPTVKVPQPDGSVLFRPGKAVVASEEIGTIEAAELLGMSRRWVEAECASGAFKTARKPGNRPRSQWKISRAEVMARREREPE